VTDFLSAPDEAAALEQLHACHCTDGLPVVIPTDERVQRMILQSNLAGDLQLGVMGPAGNAATVEKIAVSAVMAGCLPDYMPIVIAAVQAILRPEFDLTEMQATTHCTAPLLIVNGPARVECGPVSSGFGALGPGHRANASIGRALRLAMINIGGGRPGTSDMALLGHPGKFTYCLAEDEQSSPFEPLHVSRGFAEQDSVVTVVGAEAPHSVMFSGNADLPDNASRLLDVLAIGLTNAATNNAVLGGGAATVVLNPEHALILAGAGLTREQICAELYQRCYFQMPADNPFRPIKSGKKSSGRSKRYCFNSPEQILLLMAGGSGLYSMVMPSWCAGGHKNSAVSIGFDANPYCEIPAFPASS
jgi:hypothetical protein